jgi:uncharacterized protein (DUF2252 family)
VPPVIPPNGIGSAFGPDIVIVEASQPITLEVFIKAYPYPRNKHLLPPIWAKMKTEEQAQAIAAAHLYSRYCKRNEWYMPKIAASWLKNKEYLNDWKKM